MCFRETTSPTIRCFPSLRASSARASTLLLAPWCPAEEKRLPLATPSEFRSISGRGVEGFVSGKRVVAGTVSFLREQGIEIPGEQQTPDLQQDSSAVTPVYVAVGGRTAGVIFLSDRIKPSTPEAIRALRADGIRSE